MNRRNTPELRSIRRAFLPEVIGEEDVRALLMPGASEDAVRAAIVRGDFGAFVTVAGRLLLRRASVLATLAAREVAPLAIEHRGRR